MAKTQVEYAYKAAAADYRKDCSLDIAAVSDILAVRGAVVALAFRGFAKFQRQTEKRADMADLSSCSPHLLATHWKDTGVTGAEKDGRGMSSHTHIKNKGQKTTKNM